MTALALPAHAQLSEADEAAPSDLFRRGTPPNIKGAGPKMTLHALCDRPEATRERTPRGRSKWEPSSVRMILERAKKLGML